MRRVRGVEAGLTSPRAADRHPVPVEDKGIGSNVQIPSAPELVFQAFLAQDGAQRLELARA